MYSGNISLAHPLDTLLEATLYFQDRDDVVFLFVGGGQGKGRLEKFLRRYRPPNVRLLPYQPLEQLCYSLSAADVHVVSMGDDMIGIVHPCKIYGAMACARPALLLGPRECHVGELIERNRIGWQVDNDDVDGMVVTIKGILAESRGELEQMGLRARATIDGELSKHVLCARFADVVESACLNRCIEDETEIDDEASVASQRKRVSARERVP